MRELLITGIALIVVIAFYYLVKYIFRIMYKARTTVSVKVVKNLILIIGFAIIIYIYLNQFTFTKDIGKTLLQGGSLMLAIATFSCQQVLGNIISGIMLSSTKPFDIGDKITLLNTTGSIVTQGIVVDMNVRHVVFCKPDGKHDFVTNSVVDACIIENSNVLDDNGRIFTMECSYDSDVDLAIDIMDRVITECDLTLIKDLPAAKILCSRLTPNGYELKTTIWTDTINDSFEACSRLRIDIAKAWKEKGIKIPYQTVTVLEEKN